MATDLARLIVRMEAQTAKYDAALKKSNAELNKFRKGTGSALTKMQRQFESFGKAVLGFASVYVGARGLGAIVRNTIEAEKSFAQLEAAVKSTGGAAGFSAPQLAEMASALQKVSTFGDESIQAMQSVLLTFTRIRGPEFKGAQQAILDISARLGTDLKSAALQVGKALNDPIAGLGSLSRAGIQFSNDQKKAIKALVDTGKVAEAQQIILKELETQFGGSAKAARDTFGGAIEGLKNAFGDLLEGKGGNLKDATSEINKLADLMTNPDIKNGIDGITSAFFRLVGAAVKAAAAIGTVMGTIVGDEVERLTRQIIVLETRLKGLSPDSYDFKKFSAELAEANRRQQELLDLGQPGADARKKQASATPAAAPPIAIPPDAEAVRKSLDALDQELRQSIQVRNDLIRSTAAIAIPAGYMEHQLEIIRTLNSQGEAALDELERGAAKAESGFKGSVSEMSVFAEQAARNLQDSFAQFLFDPFQGGLRSMLSGFIDTMRRMVAEAASASILKSLFGGLAGSSNSFLAGLGAAFDAPPRASGGPVTKGKFYTVGEKGPELFAAGSTGRIIPNGGGGGTTIAPVYNIDARGATMELAKVLPGLFAENNRRLAETISQAMSRSGMRAPVF